MLSVFENTELKLSRQLPCGVLAERKETARLEELECFGGLGKSSSAYLQESPLCCLPSCLNECTEIDNSVRKDRKLSVMSNEREERWLTWF